MKENTEFKERLSHLSKLIQSQKKLPSTLYRPIKGKKGPKIDPDFSSIMVATAKRNKKLKSDPKHLNLLYSLLNIDNIPPKNYGELLNFVKTKLDIQLSDCKYNEILHRKDGSVITQKQLKDMCKSDD